MGKCSCQHGCHDPSIILVMVFLFSHFLSGYCLQLPQHSSLVSTFFFSPSNCSVNSTFLYGSTESQVSSKVPAGRCIDAVEDSIMCATLKSGQGMPAVFVASEGRDIATPGACVRRFSLTAATVNASYVWEYCPNGPSEEGAVVPFKLESGLLFASTRQRMFAIDFETGILVWMYPLASNTSLPLPLSSVSLGPSGDWLEPSTTNGELRAFANTSSSFVIRFSGGVSVSTATPVEEGDVERAIGLAQETTGSEQYFSSGNILSTVDLAVLENRFYLQYCSADDSLYTVVFSHFPCKYGCFGRGDCQTGTSMFPLSGVPA